MTDRLLDDLIDCSRRAGAKAMEYFRSSGEIENHNKLNDSDIVTVADKASEAVIKAFIAEHYPAHSIVSEESEATCGSEPWRWVIDPIDGTANFFAGLPLWAISIGVQHEGVTVAGVVYMPATGELFCAARGRGAWMGGKPVRVGSETSLKRVLVSTGFPVDKDTNPDNNLDIAARVLPCVRDIRRLGAASVDMCYVAAGYLGGYWEMNLHEWDICASTLILEEAGGCCSSYRGDRGIAIVCGNRSIHDQLRRLIAEGDGKNTTEL